MRSSCFQWWCVALLGAASCVGSCRTLPSKGEAETASPTADLPQIVTLPVGTVHFISQDKQFILIQSSRFLNVEPGTSMTSYGPGGEITSHLKLSPAKKHSFLTADVVSGNPGQGDRVLMDYQRGTTAGGPGASAVDSDVQVLE